MLSTYSWKSDWCWHGDRTHTVPTRRALQQDTRRSATTSRLDEQVTLWQPTRNAQHPLLDETLQQCLDPRRINAKAIDASASAAGPAVATTLSNPSCIRNVLRDVVRWALQARRDDVEIVEHYTTVLALSRRDAD